MNNWMASSLRKKCISKEGTVGLSKDGEPNKNKNTKNKKHFDNVGKGRYDVIEKLPQAASSNPTDITGARKERWIYFCQKVEDTVGKG